MGFIKEASLRMKNELGTLYYAYKDDRTPFIAKVISVSVVAYAFSPIDLIPDFIPILGYLDDLIIVPLGIFLALKLIPEEVINDSRKKSKELFSSIHPHYYIPAIIIVILWIALAYYVVSIFF